MISPPVGPPLKTVTVFGIVGNGLGQHLLSTVVEGAKKRGGFTCQWSDRVGRCDRRGIEITDAGQMRHRTLAHPVCPRIPLDNYANPVAHDDSKGRTQPNKPLSHEHKPFMIAFMIVMPPPPRLPYFRYNVM